MIDAVAAALPQMQAYARQLMTDSCVVRRPTATVPDPLTGKDVTTYAPGHIYVGVCKEQRRSATTGRDAEVGGSVRAVVLDEIHFPVAESTGITVGDVIEVSGRAWRVESLHDETWQTARRLPVSRTVGWSS